MVDSPAAIASLPCSTLFRRSSKFWSSAVRPSTRGRASSYKSCALESQLDFRAASFEQGCPQVTLERLHLQRDCWLGETQSIRRLRNTVGLDYGAESFQLLQSILLISERPH